MNLTPDICVVGAGPGGAAAAIQLEKLGRSCLVVDKATFPRDKVCGDALSGKVVGVLRRLDPALLSEFDRARQIQVDSWGIKFVAPNGYPIVVPFHPSFDRNSDPAPGYISKRVDFDAFLADRLKRSEHIDFRQGLSIDRYERKHDGWLLSDRSGKTTVQTRMLLVADGAQSKFARTIGGFRIRPSEYAVAIRGYYANVPQLDADNFIELHFLRELLPGYLWVFPLPNGEANVGIGMLKSVVQKRDIHLKQLLESLLREHPSFRDRFNQAQLTGPLKGFGLPLGTRKRPLSGDGFMLVGDAGSLIDPFTGEGIGNAMLSGTLAARRAVDALEVNDCSRTFLAPYDTQVYTALWQELRLSRRLQQLAHFPSLFNLFAFIARKNRVVSETMSAMFMDMDLREELLKPSFYVKLFLNRS